MKERDYGAMQTFQRLPQHIGIIPDGNRRWAQNKGMNKEDVYSYGIRPSFELYRQCVELGISVLTATGIVKRKFLTMPVAWRYRYIGYVLERKC